MSTESGRKLDVLQRMGDAIPVRFQQSGKRRTVSLDRVRRALVHFLEHYCAYPLVDASCSTGLLGSITDCSPVRIAQSLPSGPSSLAPSVKTFPRSTR